MTARRGKRRALLGVFVVAFLVSGCSGGPQNATPDRPPVVPIEGLRIGGDGGSYDITPQPHDNVAFIDDGRTLVRWRVAHGLRVVDAIAEVWTDVEQRGFLDSGRTVSALAEEYVRRWAPVDARLIRTTTSGGASLHYYNSDSLGRGVANLRHRTGQEAGRFAVVIPLDSNYLPRQVPVMGAGPRLPDSSPESAQFSIAIVVGDPWDAPDEHASPSPSPR